MEDEMLRRSLMTLMLAAPLAACGDDDSQSPAPVVAEYALDIEGAFTETATGPAYFGTDTDDEGEAVWVLILGQQTSRHLVVAGRGGSARPGPGSYPIADPSGPAAGWALVHLVTDGDELLGMFLAESGTVQIDASSAEEVRGSLEFEAVGIMAEAVDTIEVSGTFRAVPAPSGSASPAVSLPASSRTGARD
jgi:hypothetical protein